MLEIEHNADARKYWSIIKTGLQAILDKAPSDLDWTPADLLGALLNGLARLHIIFWDGEYAGFYVTRHLVEEFSRHPYLFLWLAYKKPGIKFDPDREIWPHLVSEARQIRAKYVSGWSPRTGWGRKYAKPWMIIYRRYV